jgi:putative ATPase
VLPAYGAALDDVRTSLGQLVPLHLRNAVTGLMREMGYGKGYRYTHNYADNVVDQQHLPDRLAGRRYYTPGANPREQTMSAELRTRRKQDKPFEGPRDVS